MEDPNTVSSPSPCPQSRRTFGGLLLLVVTSATMAAGVEASECSLAGLALRLEAGVPRIAFAVHARDRPRTPCEACARGTYASETCASETCSSGTCSSVAGPWSAGNAPETPAPALGGIHNQAKPQNAGEWPHHGGDPQETRYARIDEINSTTVANLEVAWSWEIPKTGARIETTPIVADGILYGTGAMSFVFALDAETGKPLWTWDPAIPIAEEGGPRACCGDVNRGVAVDGDLVFAGLLDGRLVALDKDRGSVVWVRQTTPAGSDYTITGAPRVVNGAVIIGNAGAEYGVRGYVSAYSAESGEMLWRTHTVPGDPALGFEDDAMAAAAETWTGEWWIAGGGGTVWDGMAYDPVANLLYVGTGNGSPWNRDHRSPGGGDNLFLSSILALDPTDGRIVWHYQTTPGDDWDYTATQPLMLLDVEIDGEMRPVIVQAPKNGFFYVLDRLTGELISAEAFADDLTWASAVDLDTGRPVETPEARYGMNKRPAYLSPGPTGAHNWPPMSWSPMAGLVYIPAQNSTYYYRMADGFDFEAGRWNTGTERGGEAARPEPPALSGPRAYLQARDPVSNTEAWRAPARGRHGGTLATAGGLVFWATGSDLLALDAESGAELWSAGIGRGPGSPVSYSAGGVQFVAVGSGIGGASPPTVWAFALAGGTSESLSAGDSSPGAAVQEATWTYGLPMAETPEEVGFSSEGLAEISSAMSEWVESERTGGILTLVARHGRIAHLETYGWRVAGEELEASDVFRIYSMTKPITSAAAMILVDEGRLSLEDAVAEYIPEFADVTVWDEGERRKPSRPVTVLDLLTHTSGLTYGIFGNTPVDSIYRENFDALSGESAEDLEGVAERVAGLPLLADPGERWNYGLSTDVLGRVVEVASGLPLDVFFRERIFEPLEMEDTDFHIPLAKVERLTTLYARGRDGLTPADRPGPESDVVSVPDWFSGGGGLLSTAADYARFCQMLLNAGELGGVRVLSEEAVELMVRNHLPEELLPYRDAWPGHGFGLGFAVDMENRVGTISWSGVANTYFWIDPEADLFAFAWTQLQPYGGAPLQRVVRPIVYEALLPGR